MLPVHVGVTQHHRQRPVAADALDGWEIDAGLHKGGDAA
jgi:hypothetical protein